MFSQCELVRGLGPWEITAGPHLVVVTVLPGGLEPAPLPTAAHGLPLPDACCGPLHTLPAAPPSALGPAGYTAAHPD